MTVRVKKAVIYNQKRKNGGVGGVPPPVVTKTKQLFRTGKERRGVGGVLGALGPSGGVGGGLGGWGGWGGWAAWALWGGPPPPVVTKKEFDTTRKQRGEGGVSSNSKFKI